VFNIAHILFRNVCRLRPLALRRETMLEVPDVVPNREDGDLLSPEQSAISQSLRRYYQLVAVGPTPKRLQMLLAELTRRAEAKPR
jgi:hypothetical protein